MKQNAGVSNIEITKDNIKAFESTAKKYGIDFALKKDSTETPPRYLVFFKGRDADALTAAFKEFSAKKLTQEQKPSIRKLIVSLKEKAASLNAQRDKVKNKEQIGNVGKQQLFKFRLHSDTSLSFFFTFSLCAFRAAAFSLRVRRKNTGLTLP